MAARVRYSTRVLELIAQQKKIIYLDEKWFYTTSRRKKLKYLRRQPHEAIGTGNLRRRKVISRKHSLKTMFIGVIAEPDENQQFDGKILIERVSKERELTRTTYRNNFHHDRHINDALKSGEWKELYPDDPTILTSEFIRLIADSYDLEEEMEDKLCL